MFSFASAPSVSGSSACAISTAKWFPSRFRGLRRQLCGAVGVRKRRDAAAAAGRVPALAEEIGFTIRASFGRCWVVGSSWEGDRGDVIWWKWGSTTFHEALVGGLGTRRRITVSHKDDALMTEGSQGSSSKF